MVDLLEDEESGAVECNGRISAKFVLSFFSAVIG